MHNNNATPKNRIVQDDSEFALIAKACMEEAPHTHAGINDLGQMMIYPCGTEFVWIFETSQLEAFLDRRNVAIANGSQYDFLYSVLQTIKEAESTKIEPKPEPEVRNLKAPVVKKGEAKYGDEDDSKEFVKTLYGLLFGDQEPLPDEPSEPKWSVDITYSLDVDDHGSMSFEVNDLDEIMDRIRNLPVKRGSNININVEFLLD